MKGERPVLELQDERDLIIRGGQKRRNPSVAGTSTWCWGLVPIPL